MRPRSIFLTRLWAFLNYRTHLGLTWLELVAASGVGLLVVWIGLRDWEGASIVIPFVFYVLLFAFYQRLNLFLNPLRALHNAIYAPLEVGKKTNPRGTLVVLGLSALFATVAVWLIDPRLSLLLALFFAAFALILFAIHDHATLGGTLPLDSVAARVPIRHILDDGEIVHRDGTRSKISLLTLGKSGYKPALQAVDIADTLTKFLAFLAQHEAGAQPIKLFWLTDYHLGRLDLTDSGGVSPDYMRELNALAKSGAAKARVIITGIVYPTPLEPRIREWLAPLDFGLSPLGAFATESLLRMLFGNESFLGQIQETILRDGLPGVAYRGFVPEQMRFGLQLVTNRNVLTVRRVKTPFPSARDAMMRALNSVEGMLTVTITPLTRDATATQLRGQLLAARVPGFGRPKEASELREILQKLEDPRALEYLFDTQTYFVTWGKDPREAQKNQLLAESYMTASNLTPVTERELEQSLTDILPVLAAPRAKGRAARFMNWLTEPPRPPGQRLLSTQAIATLATEEGSDIFLADMRGRILLGRSVALGKEGLRYADFRSDTGPVLLVSDQGGGKTSTLIVWFILRLQLLSYKIIAVNLKYSSRMQVAVEKIGGIVLHPEEDLARFEQAAREAFFSERAMIYQPVKGTRPYAIADDPCLLAFTKIFYEEWLARRETPAALVIDEIHRLMPKDSPLSANAAATATLIAEAFKDWAERKLVIAAATQTLRDLLGSNLGIALQKFRTAAYFQVGPEDREMLIEKGYEAELMEMIVGARRRPRGYCVFVMPDGFYTTMKILVTDEERDIIQRLDVEETADVTPQLEFK